MGLQWDGASAVGEGNVTAELANGLGSRDLSLDWQILCISSPEDSIEDYAAQILAVTFTPAGQPGVAETSGFAVSYNSVGQPELLNLVNSPVELSNESDSYQQWLRPANQAGLHSQDSIEESDDINLEADLKELQSLREQAARLQTMIAEKDHKIRMHLLRDCSSMLSKLKDCKCPKCFVKTSFKLVPDIFRLMKYKFGPLPSSLSGSSCRSSNRGDEKPGDANPNSEQSNITDGQNVTTGINSTSVSNLALSNALGVKAVGVRYFVRNVVASVMMVTVIVILLRYCRNTITCQRRRADLAARCEERRTLRAYRAAACRYKWRQWWDSLFCNRNYNNTVSSGHNNLTLSEGTEPHDATQAGEDTTIGAEILGLRRALEYVGGLVQYDNGSGDSQLRQRPNQLVVTEGLHARRAGTPAPSSTAPLTSIGSPRTSSVMTYDTLSLDTIDSQDTETVTIVSG